VAHAQRVVLTAGYVTFEGVHGTHSILRPTITEPIGAPAVVVITASGFGHVTVATDDVRQNTVKHSAHIHVNIFGNFETT